MRWRSRRCPFLACGRAGGGPEWSRVQTLSSASFSGLRIGPTTVKPTAALSACTAVLRTSGSTTTRRVAGSANSQANTVVMTARVKPCTGVSAGAQRKCMPTSPGSGSYRPTSSTRAGSYRSARNAGAPRHEPRYASWCGWSAMRRYSAATASTSASCISQNADLGWVTQRCSSAASASGSSGRSVNSPSASSTRVKVVMRALMPALRPARRTPGTRWSSPPGSAPGRSSPGSATSCGTDPCPGRAR